MIPAPTSHFQLPSQQLRMRRVRCNSAPDIIQTRRSAARPPTTNLTSHDDTWAHTRHSTGSILVSDVWHTLMREFEPDLKSKFFGTRLGARFQRMGQKIRTIGVKQELQ